ncbi:YopX family protein [Streptococcus suis]|uniref:YopX family protein n=1 Tax=Streptococcus suis TaxID=1307 RepID=UPI002EBDFD9E|nr:YopX family protein [Streptococcus suis]
MIPKFRAWFGSEMYDKPVVYDGEFYLDWRDFEDGKTYNGAVLMQSTGVFDKNGKEIFEGDVVNIFGEKLSKIYYSDGAFCVDILIGGTPLHAFLSEQLEIIGNIHRNPELMEEVLND